MPIRAAFEEDLRQGLELGASFALAIEGEFVVDLWAGRDLTDRDRTVARLAAQAPWWEPGTASGCHGFSFSFLIGELLRRTSGLPPDRFLREEVTDRIDADFHFGLPDSEAGRLAEPEMTGERTCMKNSFGHRVAGAVMNVAPVGDPMLCANRSASARACKSSGSQARAPRFSSEPAAIREWLSDVRWPNGG